MDPGFVDEMLCNICKDSGPYYRVDSCMDSRWTNAKGNSRLCPSWGF